MSECMLCNQASFLINGPADKIHGKMVHMQVQSELGLVVLTTTRLVEVVCSLPSLGFAYHVKGWTVSYCQVL